MKQAQEAQTHIYNRWGQLREFQPGEKVMVLVPTHECKFLAKWHGPSEALKQVGPVNNKVRQPGRRRVLQTYHVNLLKKWCDPEPCLLSTLSSEVPSQVPMEVEMGAQLTPNQKQDLRELVSQHLDVFSLFPGRTTVVYHDIVTEPGKKVRLKSYRIPEARREAIHEEARKMLDLNIIKDSNCAWYGQAQLF